MFSPGDGLSSLLWSFEKQCEVRLKTSVWGHVGGGGSHMHTCCSLVKLIMDTSKPRLDISLIQVWSQKATVAQGSWKSTWGSQLQSWHPVHLLHWIWFPRVTSPATSAPHISTICSAWSPTWNFPGHKPPTQPWTTSTWCVQFPGVSDLWVLHRCCTLLSTWDTR